MVSHPPDKQKNGRQAGYGTPGQPRATKAVSAPPSRDGHAQRAAQDVAGLKDYQLGDCLGKGAFGSVYRALNWGTGETVAIKQVRMENLPKSELKTIMLEIDLLKNLNHPNIVKYNGFVKATDSLYIILEYCENGSLHSICKNFGKFPENLVSLYMSQVLHGLLYLHEQGVIHRDIKGANILTTKEGLVKLADFGVATKASGLDESSVVGTPYWMAPEVIELSGATTSSDIWSLGCTVIELIEGKPPYHKLQPMQALFRIVNDEHPPIPGSASPAVRDFLMQCFQKNPNLRISAKRLLKHPWILSAKRTVSVVPTKPTEYDEAVKSVQEWNEALKSPNNSSLRRSSRPLTSSLGPSKTDAPPKLKTAQPTKNGVNQTKARPNADLYRSPEVDTNDNWDDDFISSISPSALHLPHLRPQDNFAGLLSSEKLKLYATFESVTEEPVGVEESEGGDLTVRSPLHFPPRDQSNDVDTAGASSSARARVSSSKVKSPNNSTRGQDFEPKTAFLRGIPKVTQLSKSKVAALARPSAIFRENSVEDYSDLIAGDESAFEKKVQAMQVRLEISSRISVTDYFTQANPAESFSPKLFHPSDLKTAPRSTQNAKKGRTMRQRSASYTPEQKGIHRSQSEIEIQKYAEDDKDKDFSDIFGHVGPSLPKADSDSGSEQNSLAMITSKMSSSFIITDEDEADPFANLEEGLENINLENNVARDRDDRLTKQTENLVGCLKTTQPDDVLLDLSEQLIQVLYESPDKKAIVLRSHGMLPILEILGTNPPRDIVLRLLKIVNMIILEDAEAQESLSFLGGIPIVSGFSHKKYPSEIRKEAAAFVRQMYQTSTLTLQMFIGCGGINVLVEFLEEDIDTERDLVLIGVNGVWSVFELQGPTPKNDFCRIFSRSSVLYPLSLVLNRVLDEKDELSELIEGRIVNIFLIFSQAESHVKDLVADRMILMRVLKDLKKMSPNHQVTMLKFIKNLSMLSSTHEALQNSNAIDVLTDLLKSSKKLPLFREISNQILNTMYNLCRHNRSRQEEAALNDVIPILKDIIQTEWPLKEFALPILCELAHSGKVARKKLWENRGLQFYISMLADRNWQVTALDAIFIWLQEETARVEQYLLSSNFSTAIVDAYCSPDTSQNAFESMLEPLQKLMRLSPPIAASLAVPEIFTRTVQKLGHKDAVARLNLLRIIRTICDATEEECALIRRYGVYETVVHLSEKDPAILVRQMAEELIRACDGTSRTSTSRGSGLRRPASRGRGTSGANGVGATPSGLSAMTPPPANLVHSVSMPPTPSVRDKHLRSQSTAGFFESNHTGTTSLSFFDATTTPAPLTRAATSITARTPGYRPASRDSSSSTSSMPTGLNGASNSNGGSSGGASSTKSRLPRTKFNRVSLAGAGGVGRREREENLTPTQNPAGKLTVVRRRRQTSGSEGVGGRDVS
ncbi:Pkinase-domain-containing protein [Lepidopterella palustris CBS 459.81]|uniref:non-specific serine/threonine protein kinase n=1 Tax=Lepidopterella palustris CBS 459.81 TaxID=1314670 RepID=A0A8E2EGL9_9PEZI|nr:Pkinase-domain-containing protein [Lepidopterella palustris CBS 459.81]